MPRSAVTIAPDLTTDTTWRTLIGAIKTGIEAMGWVQTSDTGQINFSTSVKPPGTNTTQGYALWRANDALAGTNPMIIRIAFGSAGSASQFRMNIKFGHTTDGAGTFSGITNNWDFGNMDGPSSGTTTAYDCFFSGDTNRLVVNLFENNTASVNNNVGFGLERSHDNTGADTTVGIWAFTLQGGSNSNNNRFIPYLGAMQGSNNHLMTCLPSQNSATLLGTQVGLFPTFPWYIIALNPSTQVLTYFTSDITGGTIITLPMYGATKTFYCCKNIIGGNNGGRLAMRWDT